MRLCLEAGQPLAWRRVYETVPITELRQWMSYYSVEPFGYEAEWERTASIMAMIANCMPFRDPDAPMINPADLMPKKPWEQVQEQIDTPMSVDQFRTPNAKIVRAGTSGDRNAERGVDRPEHSRPDVHPRPQ